MSDLTTDESVLQWALALSSELFWNFDGTADTDMVSPDNRATAARVARAMRLLAAYERVEAATCDCMPSTGCPESCEKCSWADYDGCIRDQLRE